MISYTIIKCCIKISKTCGKILKAFYIFFFFAFLSVAFYLIFLYFKPPIFIYVCTKYLTLLGVGGGLTDPPYLIIAGVSWGMGLEIWNFLTFPLTSSSNCWWRNFFEKSQGPATIWRQSWQVSNFAYMKNRKNALMPNFS